MVVYTGMYVEILIFLSYHVQCCGILTRQIYLGKDVVPSVDVAEYCFNRVKEHCIVFASFVSLCKDVLLVHLVCLRHLIDLTKS